ncbi:PEGA domain-containing protein [Chondromyces crocatus]|uniref:PEGA domain-containing protein n=1 Tax=Chondromyces crocatus TaxID=52 RepID=A0A0K1EP46_CHOCO|nr:PEGA domain-containing protein [Chondromyces crocatus]AKT42398.1 uncharacterized protein CMC5_066240 [Chondromyces crocatus]
MHRTPVTRHQQPSSKWVVALAAVLLTATPSWSAHAQEDDTSSSAPIKAAKMLYDAGRTSADNGEWEKAYESFSAAWRVQQHPLIALHLGRASLKTSRFVEAAERLTFFLQQPPEKLKDQDRALIQSLLGEAKQKIGTLIVKVDREGAEVLVDGRVVGQAPLMREIFVDAGKHTLEARLGKEAAEPETVELKAGESRQIALRVVPRAVEPKTLPKTPPPVAEGEGGPKTWVLIAGGAAAGVGVIAGASLTVWANSVDPDSVTGQEKADAIAQQAYISNTALWTFVGAGAVAGATVVYALVAPRKQETRASAWRLVPAVGTRDAGMWLSGSW